MPKKGHRAASRQAQLNRKKKRSRDRVQQLGAEQVEDTLSVATAVEDTTVVEVSDQGASEEQSTTAQTTAQPAPAPKPAPARAAQPAQRASQRRATSQAAARRNRQRASAAEPVSLNYKFLGTELKQIGILTTLIVAIIIGLTFALRT